MSNSTEVKTIDPTLQERRALTPPVSAKSTGPAGPKRVVVSPDEIVHALAGKLKKAAEEAVVSAADSHLSACVNDALASIQNSATASNLQFEEHCSHYREGFVASAGQEILERVQANLGPAETRVQEQLSSLAQAQETADRLERSAAEVRTRLTETLDLVRATTHELQDQFSTQLREIADRASTEARERFEASLTSLAAATRAEMEARERACLDGLAQSTDQQVERCRQQLESIVTTLVSALSAANEQSRVLLESLAADTARRLTEAIRGSAQY